MDLGKMNFFAVNTLKKRLLGLLLAVLLWAVPILANAEYDYTSIPTPKILVMDGNDGTVFYERAADERAFPASTTKIMTCLIALENGNLDDQVTVGDEVLGTAIKFTKYSSLMGLMSGETVTLRDLVYGLMLVSGNDAAEAIAVHVAGSIEGFAKLMNDKAATLGMTGTHYVNPHGVQDDNHYTTARDIGKLTVYALQNDDFIDITKTVSHTVPGNNVRAQALVLNNSNRLIKMPETDTESCVYEYAIGVKTGDTNAAGKCLVAACEKDGARVIVVLLGDTAEMYNNDTVAANLGRFKNVKAICEDLFANTYKTMSGDALNLTTEFSLPVENADADDLSDGILKVAADVSGLTIYGTDAQIQKYSAGASNIQTVLNLVSDPLSAPISAGTFLGTVDYVLDGVTLHSASLIAPSDVRAVTVIKTAADDNIEVTPASEPGSTPLIKRPGLNIGIFGWLMILLIILLVALIVVFILSERKRRKERAARRRAHRAQQRHR